MDFSHSDKVRLLQEQVGAFMDAHIYPAEARFDEEMEQNRRSGNPWQPLAVMEELKRKARAQNLWNLFLPHSEHGAGLTNLEYAPLCEIMGRSHIAPEAFNCSAPDTGNMEVLARYAHAGATAALAGAAAGGPHPLGLCDDRARRRIERCHEHPILDRARRRSLRDQRPQMVDFRRRRSALRDPDIHGQDRSRSAAAQPAIHDPGAHEHARRARRLRQLHVFGYDHAPHGHAQIDFVDVRVPVENLLLGEGRGFEIAQGRLGPGRIHHCMRLIGLAERALEMLCKRAQQRVAFGKRISEQGVTLERIAESRIMIDQARWLVLNAAYMMDTVGNRAAKKEIAMIKVAAPTMALQVIDWAIQMHGGGGVSDDFPLAAAYAGGAHLAICRRSRRSASRADRKAGIVRVTGPRPRMSDRHFKFWPAHSARTICRRRPPICSTTPRCRRGAIPTSPSWCSTTPR